MASSEDQKTILKKRDKSDEYWRVLASTGEININKNS